MPRHRIRLFGLMAPSMLIAAVTATLTATAAAKPGVSDLVLLPAAGDRWRITAAHSDVESELLGTSLVLPPPKDEAARGTQVRLSTDAKRETLELDWADTWYAALRMQSRTPLDLRPWLGGTVEFDLYVADLAKGGLRVKMDCGEGCGRHVSLLEKGRSWVGQGWQHVALPVRCFEREGADFSKVKQPFAIEGGGSGRVSVANVRLVSDGQPNLGCSDYRTESVTPVPLGESWALDWWLPLHEQKLAETRKAVAAGRSPEIVFVGDSITQGWENEGRAVWDRHYLKSHALDLGFGGDRTENVLWRLHHGAVDGLAPKVAVLMIGTNNTGHRSEDPQTTAAGIKRIVEELRLRLPTTQVLLLGVFPRDEKPDGPMRRINARVNKIIAGYADGRWVHFLDIGAALTNPDGTLSKDVTPDMLHLSEKGYVIWQHEMDPLLQTLLKSTR